MKKIAQKVVIILGILLFLCWSYTARYSNFWDSRKTELNCGTVVNVLPGARETKHRLVDELYLGVKFDNGVFKAVEVSPTTYMSKTIGDRVCFEISLSPRQYHSVKSLFGDLFLFVIIGVLIISVFLGIINLFMED